MAKLAALIDDFQDGVIDAAKWTADPGVTETGGRIRITPSTSYPILGSITPRIHDLTDSQVVAYVPVVTSNGSTGSLQCGMVVDKDANNSVGIRKVGSQLICSKTVASTETQLSFTPYSAVNHLFWRIRADATNIYWETSSTGTGYFIQHTANIAGLGFAITTVGVYFFAGYSGVEPFPGTFQIEAVNPGLAFISSGASTSTGSLDWVTTAPGELAASGESISSGSLVFTLILPGTINFVSAAASTSSGNLDATLLAAGTLAFVSSATSTSLGFLVFSIAAAVEEEPLQEDYYYFEPPIAYDLPPTLPEPTRPRYLNAHARWKGGQRRGRSVLKLDGQYITIDTPTVDQTLAATELYQGGHIYTVPKDIANALSAAGYTVIPIPFVWNVYPDDGLYPAESLYPGFSDVILEETPPPPPEPPILLPSPLLLPSPVLVP